MERGRIFPLAVVALLLFLSVTLYLSMTAPENQSSTGWSRSIGSGPGWNNMYVGDNDTLYATGDDKIYALDKNGGIRWILKPDLPLWIEGDYTRLVVLGAADEDGKLFLVLFPSLYDDMPVGDPQLMAISADGEGLWNTSFRYGFSAPLRAVDSRLYALNYDTLEVRDMNGKLLWNATCIERLAVDSRGNVYTVQGYVIKAYDRDGTALWSHSMADYGIKVDPTVVSYLSIDCGNDTVVVWTPQFIAALNPDGSPKWIKQYPPFTRYYYGLGDADRVYTVQNNATSNYPAMSVIDARGNETKLNFADLPHASTTIAAVSDDTVYYATQCHKPGLSPLEDIDYYLITAYDLRNQQKLWEVNLNAGDPRTVTMNETNVREIMQEWDARQAIADNMVPPGEFFRKNNVTPGDLSIVTRATYRASAGSRELYIGYWAYNYEYPELFGSSRCACYGGIYAIDPDGKLAWSRQTDTPVNDISEKNGTVYYRTHGGKISAAGISLAPGLTAAALYLLLRVFVFGAVSRARSKLDRNDNRNQVFALIADRPGSTMREIARALGMNLGTVRYHLLILSLNHKITTYDDGEKFVRYFRNSNEFTEDEKLILSLAKRESLGGLLEAVLDRPGSSNADLAAMLGLPESAVSKYLKLLAGKGVILRASSPGEKPAFKISERFLPLARACLSTPKKAAPQEPASHLRTVIMSPDSSGE